MVSFQFDGSEKGLFCCLFVSYTQKKHPDLVTDGVLQQRLGDETIGILTDDAAAEREHYRRDNLLYSYFE